jgi:methyl-accepting chemotaxis protein
MRLRTQLIVAFLACGIVPLAVSGWLSFSTARRGMTAMEKTGEVALEQAAEDQLVAIRGLKKQQLETYFETLRTMLINFSENPSVVSGFLELRESARKYTTELKGFDPQAARTELQAFYTADYANEYRKQNEGRQADVNGYLSRLDDTQVALQLDYIRNNPNQLGQKHLLERAKSETTYNTAHARLHPLFRNSLEQFVLYDIFLVDAETGDIVYSVFKEIDFGTSLKTGPLAKSSIGEVFRKALDVVNDRDVVMTDFSQYFPSYEAPAGFIASPITIGKDRKGVMIFQVPLDRVTAVMSDRSGLGETGETLLVGGDFLPRSDSYRDTENRTVIKAFRNPSKGRIETEGIRKAVTEGVSGFVKLKDYVGNEVVSAFGPVEVLGVKWAITAKRDVSEALASVATMNDVADNAAYSLLLWTTGVALLATFGVGVVAIWKGNQIARPIIAASKFAQKIAAGELTQDCNERATAEAGELIAAMNQMRVSLKELVCKLSGNARTLSQSSESLSSTASQLASGADEATHLSTSVTAAAEEMSSNMTCVSASTEEMSSNVRTVAAAVEEMTASIAEVAQNAERAAGVAQEATMLTERSNVQIAQLGTAASEIGKVIEVIQDIAEQTNLLALNATIEAARAGEAGKGFAVVATEVKELAKQTATATDDIRTRIEAIQAATTEAIQAIGNIEGVIRNVNDVSRTIASAVEEQRITTTEIAKSVAETSSAVQTVTKSIAESAMASREITQNMSRVDSAARQTSTGASSAKDAGDELLMLAEELEGLIQHFKIEEKQHAVAAG